MLSEGLFCFLDHLWLNKGMKVIQRNSLLFQASLLFLTVPVHLVFPETKEERMRKVEPGRSLQPFIHTTINMDSLVLLLDQEVLLGLEGPWSPGRTSTTTHWIKMIK